MTAPILFSTYLHEEQNSTGKAQVELAQYQYILPRLRGMWETP